MWWSCLKGNRSFYIIPTRDTHTRTHTHIYIYIYIYIWVCLKMRSAAREVWLGGMIRGYDSGYGSGVWFAELELPTLTKICIPEKKTQPYIYNYIMIGILNNYVSVNHHSLKGYVLVRTFHSFIFVWSLWSPRPPPNKYPFPWHPRKRQLFRLFTMALQ